MSVFIRLALLVPLLLAACGGYQAAPPASQESIDYIQQPAIGEIATANIGDPMVEKATIKASEGVRLTEIYQTEWVRNSGSRAFPMTFDQGAELHKISEQNGVTIFVGPSAGGMQNGDGQQLGAPYGLGIAPDGTVHYVYAYGGTIPETPNRRVSFERKKIISTTSGTLRQEFIYSGRSGGVLSFIYREFANDLARPAFSQNVSYDLKDGNIIGFKKRRLKIISAGNMTINYQLEQSF